MKALHITRLLTEEEAQDKVTPEEWTTAQKMGLPRRRREWLTWRAVVREQLGREVEISYDSLGAPRVALPHVYISVSHCKEGVAVSFSEHRCAVDIESRTRNFERVAPRYLTSGEAHLSQEEVWPALVWSAKETLYKYAAREGLDFVDDLSVVAVSPTRQRLSGRITTPTHTEEVEMAYIVFRDSVVVYTI